MKQMIIYVRYLSSDGEATTRFLGVVELSDGTGVTITDALVESCGKMDLNIRKQLVGLGSDGASVMLGCRGGVSTLMKGRVSYLIANHCVAHRLALTCGQAADEITYLRAVKACHRLLCARPTTSQLVGLYRDVTSYLPHTSHGSLAAQSQF